MAWGGKGSTRAWRAARLRVLARDGYACQLRLAGCLGRATEVHHTRGRGISELDADLVAACQPCNGPGGVGDPTRTDPAPTPRTSW